MHRDAGRWRHGGGVHPCHFKRGAMGAEVPFHHRFRSRKILGVAKDFCPNSPKLLQKVFCATFTYNFSPTEIMKTFFGVASKKGLHLIFCKPWGPCFEVEQGWAPFSRGFSGMFPDFQQIKTFGGALEPHLQQAPLFFHNSIIGNFVVYQDRIET